jgi:hypothetical protein
MPRGWWDDSCAKAKPCPHQFRYKSSTGLRGRNSPPLRCPELAARMSRIVVTGVTWVDSPGVPAGLINRHVQRPFPSTFGLCLGREAEHGVADAIGADDFHVKAGPV